MVGDANYFFFPLFILFQPLFSQNNPFRSQTLFKWSPDQDRQQQVNRYKTNNSHQASPVSVCFITKQLNRFGNSCGEYRQVRQCNKTRQANDCTWCYRFPYLKPHGLHTCLQPKPHSIDFSHV